MAAVFGFGSYPSGAPTPARLTPGDITEAQLELTLRYRARLVDGESPFALARSYVWVHDDPVDGDRRGVYVVPGDDLSELVRDDPDVDPFTTDLASIPQFFAWLVPPLGGHLRAVVLHDALVVSTPIDAEDAALSAWTRRLRVAAALAVALAILALMAAVLGLTAQWMGTSWTLPAGIVLVAVLAGFRWWLPSLDQPVQTGRTHFGPLVGRVGADAILRRSLAVTGTGPVRRWLIWAAITLATAWAGPMLSRRHRFWWRVLVVVTLGSTVALGIASTIDLAGGPDLVPWMDGRGPWTELALGVVAAVAVPIVLSVSWGRLWAAPAIGGVAVALLLHVTVAVVLVYALYWILEAVARRIVDR